MVPTGMMFTRVVTMVMGCDVFEELFSRVEHAHPKPWLVNGVKV